MKLENRFGPLNLDLESNSRYTNMTIKPAVALRAILVGGIAAFAKIGGAVKAAGGVKLGAAAAAMTAAATAAVSGSKKEEKKDGSQQLSPK
ncbi:hypothetical protein CQW23_14696 [Capsicum baccatum]|uniref:Uncharacterized protein n=3 Tax=Capsicum TaxID=4071 RepID=A0A2G2ZA04_CAPAN|nr:hypothetical protein CQW23_14696 [Capsicum baccatum]PHT78837.1 hypothetical protein T459_16889 [Capsicum annuum]